MAKRKESFEIVDTELFEGLGSGESSEIVVKEFSDLIGDNADFALSTRPSWMPSHKSGLPMYVVEAMIKAGKHTVNIGSGEIKVW